MTWLVKVMVNHGVKHRGMEKIEWAPTQEFLRTHYKEHYEAGHPKFEFSFSTSKISSLQRPSWLKSMC